MPRYTTTVNSSIKTSSFQYIFAYIKKNRYLCNTFQININKNHMKTSSQYRAQAREVLQNRWGEAAIMQVVILGLVVILSAPSALATLHPEFAALTNMSSLATLLILPIQYAFYNVLLRALRSENESWWSATWQIVSKQFGRFFLAGLLIMILTILIGIVTLGIGAIILAYAYSMVPYLLYDYPELSIREAMKISREMTRGHKWELFVLDLTFIGWIILSMLTAGIGILFVEPYQQAARCAFYEDLKHDTIVEEDDLPTTDEPA
jgi:uncharacterized membrane protein